MHEEILSQEEITNLLNLTSHIDEKVPDSSFRGDAEVQVPKKIKIYNFRRPDRISKEQLRSLNFIHDRFARNFSTSFSVYMRSIVEVNLKYVEQISYSEFLSSLCDPTFICAVKFSSLEGNFAIEINPKLVFPIIDKLLGGTGGPADMNREITEIERSIMEGVIRLALEDLESVWSNILEMKFFVQSIETSPQLIQIIAPNEIVVVVVFEIKIG